ncbi:hypothetical protein ADICEAN_00203 [Cesiribacter andamanensis AMV16]|uniref:Uncharacterized protein n=1 Tax=Cesiribacter andamanensis AMV16 TaxID=1279009 RepID=M7NBN9_9BACT|nr:hypothetical protein ADICEAN_00203 [Cesiribacter andamanensis AMV16]
MNLEAFFIKVGCHLDHRERSWKVLSNELSYAGSLPLVEMTSLLYVFGLEYSNLRLF